MHIHDMAKQSNLQLESIDDDDYPTYVTLAKDEWAWDRQEKDYDALNRNYITFLQRLNKNRN
jgi:hypothetical protein